MGREALEGLCVSLKPSRYNIHLRAEFSWDTLYSIGKRCRVTDAECRNDRHAVIGRFLGARQRWVDDIRTLQHSFHPILE